MRIAVIRWLVAAMAGASIVAASTDATADAVSDFYKGKEIRVIIGYPPGGGYDVYARTVTRHMARHIPGNPTVVPQNMPGAGSAIAAQYLLKKAARDGTVLGTISQYTPYNQVANDLTDKFDMRELNWIGNPDELNAVMPIWAASGITSIDDAKTKEVVMGTTAANGAGALNLRVLNNIVGTKFKIIAGYAGSSRMRLAMERGEIDGRGSDSLSALQATKPDWLEKKQVNFLVQFGFERDPAIPEVPLLLDLAKNPAERMVFEMMSANSRIGRPIVTTPEVPADRLAALQAAFDATMTDPKFLADAKKQDLHIKPVRGPDLEEAVAKVVKAPQDVVTLFKAGIASGKTFNCLEIAKDKSLCSKPKKK